MADEPDNDTPDTADAPDAAATDAPEALICSFWFPSMRSLRSTSIGRIDW